MIDTHNRKVDDLGLTDYHRRSKISINLYECLIEGNPEQKTFDFERKDVVDHFNQPIIKTLCFRYKLGILN